MNLGKKVLLQIANCLSCQVREGIKGEGKLKCRLLGILVNESCLAWTFHQERFPIVLRHPTWDANFRKVVNVWNTLESGKPLLICGSSSDPFFQQSNRIHLAFLYIIANFRCWIISIGSHTTQDLPCVLLHLTVHGNCETRPIVCRPSNFRRSCWKCNVHDKEVRTTPRFGPLVVKLHLGQLHTISHPLIAAIGFKNVAVNNFIEFTGRRYFFFGGQIPMGTNLHRASRRTSPPNKLFSLVVHGRIRRFLQLHSRGTSNGCAVRGGGGIGIGLSVVCRALCAVVVAIGPFARYQWRGLDMRDDATPIGFLG
mmetsp:Transcript_14826/g.32300  ORF Transcript_14826/g.32300 Transcript_14826/m.32300 type:complete len:311 (-) Transcript_14826:997-1929(-)